MSSGKVHATASLVLAAGFSLGAIVSQDTRILECVAGALVGLFVTPDLDLSNGGIVGGRFIQKNVGWFGKRLWERFWRGYSSSFKHGTWASHSIVFGTFMRLAYIYFWTIFIPHVIIKLLFNPNWDLMYVLQWYGILFLSPLFFYGLAASDLIHIFLDHLTKEHK